MMFNLRVNVFGSIYVTAVFAPLVRAGGLKQIVVLSTGLGDLKLTAEMESDNMSPYCISKAALNMAVAKFHSELKKDGLIVMGISPGLVDTGFGRGDSFGKLLIRSH